MSEKKSAVSSCISFRGGLVLHAVNANLLELLEVERRVDRRWRPRAELAGRIEHEWIDLSQPGIEERKHRRRSGSPHARRRRVRWIEDDRREAAVVFPKQNEVVGCPLSVSGALVLGHAIGDLSERRGQRRVEVRRDSGALGEVTAAEVLHQHTVSSCGGRGLRGCPLRRLRIPLVQVVIAGDAVDGVVDRGLDETEPEERLGVGLSLLHWVLVLAIVATAIAFQALMTAGSAAPAGLSALAAGAATRRTPAKAAEIASLTERKRIASSPPVDASSRSPLSPHPSSTRV